MKNTIIGFVNFDFQTLISFFLGVIFGIIVVVLFYTYYSLKNVRNYQSKSIIQAERTVSEDAILMIIKNAKDAFLDKSLQKDLSLITHLKDICFELVYDIASVFFPNSKYPLLELSIDELLMLTDYINKRLDEILTGKFLKNLRKIKVSDILRANEIKQNVEKNKILEITRKHKLIKKFSTVKDFVNLINPVNYVKKLVINNTINIVVKKIGVVVIDIVAEETYKIYSKRVFNREVVLKTDVNLLIDEINEESEEL